MNLYSTSGIALPRWLLPAALCVCLALSGGAAAQSAEKTRALQALGSEREMLTAELVQYQKTLDILQEGNKPPEQSSNPAVRKLAEETVRLKKRLIAIAEREVTLLQQQIADARTRQADEQAPHRTAPSDITATVGKSTESKPLYPAHVDYTRDFEAENVERLHQLLENYHAQVQEAARTLPTEDELDRRELARRDALKLSRIPFNANKVRLTGAEGSTALAHITERLIDPEIPESRRDVSLICVIRTRLFGQLVGSESRSLTAVGKNHYVARVRLQPGNTTLIILDDRWEVRLPDHVNGRDFLITFYRPPVGEPELHAFAIDDLLALDRPHIPAWLPDELNIRSG